MVPTSELCTCDGVFFEHPYPNIAYAPTPGSRREHFTLVHEFAHYPIRRDHDVLSALHDLDDDAGQVAEERVCHAFAGLILVPDPAIERILVGRPPEARHLRELFAASSCSLEACTVRLAEWLPANGYVVIADPAGRRIRFASSPPAASYRGAATPPPPPDLRPAHRHRRHLPALRRQHLGLHRLPDVRRRALPSLRPLRLRRTSLNHPRLHRLPSREGQGPVPLPNLDCLARLRVTTMSTGLQSS